MINWAILNEEGRPVQMGRTLTKPEGSVELPNGLKLVDAAKMYRDAQGVWRQLPTE